MKSVLLVKSALLVVVALGFFFAALRRRPRKSGDDLLARMRRLGWIIDRLFSPYPTLKDLGRVVVMTPNGYTRTRCEHCVGRWRNIYVVDALSRPPTSRGLPAQVCFNLLGSFCLRCGHAERGGGAKDLLRDVLGVTESPFHIGDVLDRLECANGVDAHRLRAVRQEIDLHQAAIDDLRRSLSSDDGGPYRSARRSA